MDSAKSNAKKKKTLNIKGTSQYGLNHVHIYIWMECSKMKYLFRSLFLKEGDQTDF